MRDWPALLVRFPAGCPAEWPDLVSAALDGLDVVAIDEPSGDTWRVCFRSPEARAAAAAALDGLAGAGLDIRQTEMPDEDWARRSQAALGAIRVGRIVVAPPWDPAASAAPDGVITVVIEPGMGFGSGHHATTRLCLRALLEHPPTARSVLDIGTGSGVLAIAAAKLGAASVLAVEVDADALESARTNAGFNGHPPALSFMEADFRSEPLPPADIVLANLTGGMLAASAGAVMGVCKPGGVVILSGITTEEARGVAEAFQRHARIQTREDEDGWVSLVVSPAAA